MSPVVLGLDLSTHTAGAAWVNYDTGRLEGWTVFRPKASLDAATRCAQIGAEVRALVDRLEPIDVWAEDIGTRHVAPAIAMGRVHQAVFQALGGSYGVLSPAEVKRHATGAGRATKGDMIAAARVRWPWFDGGHDEADAAWVADFGRSRVVAAVDAGRTDPA